MIYHPLTQKIVSLLKDNNFWHETFEHEPVLTSEEASKVRTGYSLKQGTKAMIIRVKENSAEKNFIMLVIPGDKKINFKKFKKDFNFKDLTFANEEEIEKLTGGVKIGGIPPFGNLFDIRVIADPSVFENEKIIFNAGDRSFSVAMKSEDYTKLVNPKIYPIIS